MTDEEKAEEYTHKTHIKYNDILSQSVVVDEIRKAHIAGLKAGREESESHLLENWCRNEDDYCPHLKQLEAQIDKMKCCGNCDLYPCDCDKWKELPTNCCEEWGLAE